MRRAISISVVAVLAGWLAAPALAAGALVCSMQCCRRSPAVGHSHCGEMDSRQNNGPSSLRPVASRCPGCVAQGIPNRLMLATFTPNSIPFYCITRRTTVRDADGAEPKLFQHAGRAPPAA